MVKPEIRTKPIPERPCVNKAEEARLNAAWWQEHRTDQRFLIKPQYESRFARSDKSERHTKEDFVPYTINRLVSICKGVDAKERLYRPKDPKSAMPGFAVGAVQDDFYETSLKAENFRSTEILVIDVDDVPKTITNIGLWLPTVLPSNVFALWYSTPRWREDSKRIRVVIPLARPISMQEKLSMATRLSIPGADKASFEAAKFSLLPCWCEDTVDFYWGTVGHRRLNPDADLPKWVPERPAPMNENPFRSFRIQNEAQLYEALDKVAEAINDAPCGGSQPIIKSEIGKLLAKFKVEEEDLEYLADQIDRDDRRKDTYGIGIYILNRERAKT